MRIVFFVHSLLSDWNHGNAHFLRGVATELVSRGHGVAVYEPRDAWSLRNLVAEYRGDGETALVLQYLRDVPEHERRDLGQRARARVLREHTAAHRAEELEGYALRLLSRKAA